MTTARKLWLVEPRDTLIVRDARPVMEGSGPMRSLDFPWPSSVAGLIRSRIGLDAEGVFRLDPEEARSIPVAGPVLWSVDRRQLLVPAPADCVWFRADSTKNGGVGSPARERVRLRPRPLADDERTDLRAERPGLEHLVLASRPSEPAGQGESAGDGGTRKAKPIGGPAFWRWEEVLGWLTEPADLTSDPEGAYGLPPLLRERRTHVAIEPGRGTASDGQLFQTEALRFVTPSRERLALGLLVGDPRLDARAGVVQLGGERRPSFLQLADPPSLPGLPDLVRRRVHETRRARVLLTTPAIFSGGSLPGGGSATFGAGVTVTAAAVGRPEAVSGWDFRARGPKSVRRAAPRGAVYWVELDAGWGPDRIDAWLDATWFGCVSDDEQDRKDGFGLALVGVA